MSIKFKSRWLLLQKLALENECGIPDNPLNISWLDGNSSSTDANTETVLEASDSTRNISGEAAADSKVIMYKYKLSTSLILI